MKKSLNEKITGCSICPRLVKWREKVAQEKRASFSSETYWGKPLVGFGDDKARLLVVGLAPAAHGANRTGRMFTGDRSGDWLYRALHKAGFANQAQSVSRDDGLQLKNAYVSAIVRCAPPDNKPTPQERDQCIPYFVQELQCLKNVRVILALGSFALNGLLRLFQEDGLHCSPKPKFAHGLEFGLGPYVILSSYHPSQQNTFTKRLTEPMFDQIFARVQNLLNSGDGSYSPFFSILRHSRKI